jgi:hypothetical protein
MTSNWKTGEIVGCDSLDTTQQQGGVGKRPFVALLSDVQGCNGMPAQRERWVGLLKLSRLVDKENSGSNSQKNLTSGESEGKNECVPRLFALGIDLILSTCSFLSLAKKTIYAFVLKARHK